MPIRLEITGETYADFDSALLSVAAHRLDAASWQTHMKRLGAVRISANETTVSETDNACPSPEQPGASTVAEPAVEVGAPAAPAAQEAPTFVPNDPDPAPVDPPKTSAKDKSPKLEDVQAALTGVIRAAVAAKFEKPRPRELALRAFSWTGAKTLPEVKPEQYAQVLRRAQYLQKRIEEGADWGALEAEHLAEQDGQRAA